MISLTPAQETQINSASSTGIEDAFSSILPDLSAERWLSKRNRYRLDTINRIKNDPTIFDGQLARYIAASSVGHCIDGWGFLGRALEAGTFGDAPAARHLAYYAELRAAMSLLASDGIGIFNYKHYIITAHNQCTKIDVNAGTHAVIWPVFQYWSSLGTTIDLLSEEIKPLGISLRDWIKEFNVGISLALLGPKWLTDWGLDLQRLGDDHDARNEASYRPSQLNGYTHLNFKQGCNFLEDLWSMCEPSPYSFEKLDQQLLRKSLRTTYKDSRGTSATRKEYRFLVNSMLDRFGIDSPTVSNLLLSTGRSVEAHLLTMAEKNGKPSTDKTHHLQVISRAFLLLRLATAANTRRLSKAGITGEMLSFWWVPYGEGVGLWAEGATPDDRLTLWDDVEHALTAVRETSQNDLWSFSMDDSLSLRVLHQCERIPVMSLGI